ncbi:MAG: FkbM family methyltransferase [Planctomycetes bacterium]|nr:FkbM family methyltransferase [Planctomycetota bacterium]
MNRSLAKLCLPLLRGYIRRFPDSKGIWRLRRFLQGSVIPSLPPETRASVVTSDGRTFEENIHEPWFFLLMATSRRDPAETALLKNLLKTGDCVIDIGANYGWYSTWMAKLVGPNGAVHAFEPTPPTMELLRRNCDANEVSGLIAFNRVGLSNAPGKATIHVPAQHGGASLKPYFNAPTTPYEIELITLDSYVEKKRLGDVALIKIDVEGSELPAMKGATKLLSAPNPPLWMLEISRNASREFGYTPEEMLAYLAQYGYQFCLILEKPRGRLARLSDLSNCRDADNVLCYHPSSKDRVEKLTVTK